MGNTELFGRMSGFDKLYLWIDFNEIKVPLNSVWILFTNDKTY
jgi:hypothetical protein